MTSPWSAIIGHAAQVGQLERALASGALAQAYLFAGPRGVGKALVAQNLAASVILSPSPRHLERSEGSHGSRAGSAKDLKRDSSAGFTLSAANVPQNDNRAARGQHPDLIWLRVLPDKSEILMEQWRAVEAKVQFRALEGERKFIIIDDAELMSSSVANACLKTLEEPPPFTHFILVAHDADRLLPTIRSRCQHMVFAPLSQPAVEKWLVTQGTAPDIARRVSVLAQGSLHRAQQLATPEALALLDAVLRDINRGITPQQVLSQAIALSAHEALPSILDGVALALREPLIQRVDGRGLRRIRAVEQASQFLSVKGANKELILNEMFITLSA